MGSCNQNIRIKTVAHQHTSADIINFYGDVAQVIADFGTGGTSASGGDPRVNNLVYSNSANWNSVYNSYNSNSANWSSVYNTSNSNSANWNSVYSSYNSNSANFITQATGDARYVNVSGDIMTGGLSAPSLSCSTLYVGASTIFFINAAGQVINSIKSTDVDRWQSTVSMVTANSARWISNYNTTNTNSARWVSTYNTTNNNSANWNVAYNQSNVIATVSANYDSVYSSVATTSGTWDYAYNTIAVKEATWDFTAATVAAGSSTWNDTATIVAAGYGQWNIAANGLLADVYIIRNGTYIAFNAADEDDSGRGQALEAAISYATVGDSVIINPNPGVFEVTSSLAKNGVRLYGEGITIRRYNDNDPQGIFDDGDASQTTSQTMAFQVYGSINLDYKNNSAGNKEASRCAAVATRNSNSSFYIELGSIATSCDTNDVLDPTNGSTVMAGLGEAGTLVMRVRRNASAACRGWLWGWTNGKMDVICPENYGDDYGIWWGVSAAPTGDFYFQGNYIETGHSEPLYSTCSNASARAWITIPVIKTALKSCVFHGGKTYIKTMKVYGGLVCSPQNCDTEVWANGHKVEAVDTSQWDNGDGTFGISNDSELICHRNDGTGIGLMVLDFHEYDGKGYIKHPDRGMFYLHYGRTIFKNGLIRGYTDNLTWDVGQIDEGQSRFWNIGSNAAISSSAVIVEFKGLTFDDVSDTSTQHAVDLNKSDGPTTIRATGCTFMGGGNNDIRYVNNGAGLPIIFVHAGCIGLGTNGAVRVVNA